MRRHRGHDRPGEYFPAKERSGQSFARSAGSDRKITLSSAFYVLLGQVELRNQDSAKAEAAFQKAIELDQNNITAFLMLANVQVSRGSVDQAIDAYHRAIQTNPRDVRAYVALGGLLEARNQWQEAQDLYKKALAIQPTTR